MALKSTSRSTVGLLSLGTVLLHLNTLAARRALPDPEHRAGITESSPTHDTTRLYRGGGRPEGLRHRAVIDIAAPRYRARYLRNSAGAILVPQLGHAVRPGSSTTKTAARSEGNMMAVAELAMGGVSEVA